VLVSGVVVLVTFGLSLGLWLPNVHNGLLAVSLTFVGAYVLFQRPQHREGILFLAAGVVEGVMFLGRQVGHEPFTGASPWWGWLGVWPLVVALALTTFAVVCFPDGRLPGPRWRPVAIVVLAVTLVLATLSALWPVEYASTGVRLPHPLGTSAPTAATIVWRALAHPAYAGFQVLWVLALVTRWRSSSGPVRRQVAWLVAAAGVSLVALVAGLAIGGTPVPGLITTAFLPVTAGWAIVHGQHVAAYSALTWLSRTGPGSETLPADLTRATAEALGASGAQLWLGSPAELRVVGTWPDTDEEIPPHDLGRLQSSPSRQSRAVTRRGVVVGALSIDRASADALPLMQAKLFDDLAAQAALVLDHLTLADVIARHRRAGHLEGLSPRERDVLELMAQGLSNAAICEQLHLSVKTVEPVVSTIFTKLGLHADAASNRRVLAVLAYERG
jgi:DNA-binding CsgD family transcriptional regulator